MHIEAIERAGPSFPMAVVFMGRPERRLMEGHSRAARLLRERHRHQGLEAAFALLLPGEGEDEALGRNDFAKHAALPEFASVIGRAQAMAPMSAGAGVDLHVGGRVVP